MSQTQKRLMTTGAVMVALSSFVPNPLLTSEAYAQATSSTTLNASATVVNPLGLTPGVTLKVGKFAVKGAGKILLTAAGAQSNVSNAVLIGGASTQAGTVKLTAPTNVQFTISIPTFNTGGTVKLAHSAKTTGTATAKYLMSITQIRMAAGGTTANKIALGAATLSNGVPTATAKIPGTATDGVTTIDLGARLSFGAAQTAGTYSGDYRILTTF